MWLWYGPYAGTLTREDTGARLLLDPDKTGAANVAGLGDVDGDGFGELGIGVPMEGAAYVIFGGER